MGGEGGGGPELLCPWCPHQPDPHVTVATEFLRLAAAGGGSLDVPVGGYTKCPEPECECLSTWSVPQLTDAGGGGE